jgi:hypothetical protein
MYNSLIKQGTGEKLDVMDDIYNEMWSCVMEKKLPIFAPYIMELIEETWQSVRGALLMHSIPLTLTTHEVKSHRIETHSILVEDAPPVVEKQPSWVSKLARHMQQIFCLPAAINKR